MAGRDPSLEVVSASEVIYNNNQVQNHDVGF